MAGRGEVLRRAADLAPRPTPVARSAAPIDGDGAPEAVRAPGRRAQFALMSRGADGVASGDIGGSAAADAGADAGVDVAADVEADVEEGIVAVAVVEIDFSTRSG